MPQLEQQAIGRSDRGAIVIAELWSGFPPGRDDRPRWAAVFSQNGQINHERSGGEADIKRLYGKVAAALARRPLTEDQARDELAEAGLPRERHCAVCSIRLSVSGRFCAACGTPHGERFIVGRPAPGSSATPIVMVPMRTT